MLRNSHSAGSLPLEKTGSSSNNDTPYEQQQQPSLDSDLSNGSNSGSDINNKKRRSSQASIPSRSQYALVLVLSPLNGTFERKSLFVPFAPEVLKLGRQTSAKTIPAPDNGFFDSRVLSRQHAEVWADRASGKVWIKDAKSSNGTYINSQRLSNDNTESNPHELKKNDILELGIDISNDDGSSLVHRKISAKVERVSIMSLQADSATAAASPTAGTPSSNRAYSNGGLINGGNNLNGSSNGGNLSRSNTITGSRQSKFNNSNNTNAKAADSLDVALFGDVDASLEDLVMGHARNSLGGLFMNSGLNSSISFENTVKKLIAQIHEAKLEGAKINSVTKLLDQIGKNQSNSTVLTTLTEQLASKDAYIAQLEKKLEEKQQQEDAKVSQSESDLVEARKEIEVYKGRALAAEEIALKSSKTISELVKTLEDKQQEAPTNDKKTNDDDKNIQSITNDNDNNDQYEKSDNNNNNDNKQQQQKITTNKSSRSTTSSTTQHQHVSSFGVKAIPVSSALGVVIIGISIMTVINNITRER